MLISWKKLLLSSDSEKWMLLVFNFNNFQQKPLNRFQKNEEKEKDILHKKGSFFAIFIVDVWCSLTERIVFLSLVKKG